MQERLAIVGAGAIASGLAVTASRHGTVVLWARSDASARRAREAVERGCELTESDARNVRIETDLASLAGATAVVEAVIEDLDAKASVWREVRGHVDDDALLASTTSSLPVQAIAEASGAPDRFVGLHVFNPVPKMQLVELVFPAEATETTRRRATSLCDALGKIPVTVPDTPGFVVNRLLFPYLFAAVTLQDETGLSCEAIDTCMQLGAGHPIGPLALLDFVGLDVSQAIGRAIGIDVPARIDHLVADGALGRKAKRGFYEYD